MRKPFGGYLSLKGMEKAAFIVCQKWDSLSECQCFMCYWTRFCYFKGINMASSGVETLPKRTNIRNLSAPVHIFKFSVLKQIVH